MAAAASTAREEELVARAKAGSGEAFEALFRRYRDRISAYVRVTIGDDGRTEDLVQEIFVGALRSLPALESTSAFKPWIYQIARNACLDELRRRSRTDEIFMGTDDFPPPDERLIAHSQSAHGALLGKEELEHLREALDGLPESQHDALVLRELAGLSYDEIGRHLRLSRPAVESIIFRARRGLKGEYSEITTGERCKRMHSVMVQVTEGAGTLRERRTLLRHMGDCAACRREAAAMGLAGLAVPVEERHGVRAALSRVAALIPLPTFFSRRAEESEQVSSVSSLGVQAQNAATQLSSVGGASADHVTSALHKAAAVVAAVAVVGGGGVAVQKSGIGLSSLKPAQSKSKSDAAKETSLPVAVGSKGGAKEKAVPLLPSKAGTGQDAAHPSAPAALGGAGAGNGVTSPGAPGASAPPAGAPAGALPQGSDTPATSDPLAGAPAVSAPVQTPAADSPKGNKKGSGGQSGGSGSGGSGSGGSSGGSTGGGTSPTSTVPTGGVNVPGIPPGIQKKLDSGALTIDELPNGLKKKLAGVVVP
jgi:RNA polymerase sigma factor (sigma-70 family)